MKILSYRDEPVKIFGVPEFESMPLIPEIRTYILLTEKLFSVIRIATPAQATLHIQMIWGTT